MTGEQTPLLRRPIVSGCARGAVRPKDLGICLELQARLVVASAGARVLRKGERWMVSSRLVDASCEVGKGLCWDILCLIRWVGIRHTVGLSGVGERPRTETREGHAPGDRSYLLVDEHSPRGMRSAGSLHRRKASRTRGLWCTGRICVTMVQERARMAGETMQMWGECWSCSEAASGNVESHLGRSVAYVRARPVTRADGSQGP
jgi:hypothetical protein